MRVPSVRKKPEAQISYENTLIQQGRKEVVDWGKEDCPHTAIELGILCVEEEGQPDCKRECGLCWETKLKEWGL